MKSEQPVYILELRAVPGNHRADPVQRLRALLKAALRGYGFRCLSARPAPPAAEAKGQGGHLYDRAPPQSIGTSGTPIPTYKPQLVATPCAKGSHGVG